MDLFTIEYIYIFDLVIIIDMKDLNLNDSLIY